MGAERDYTNCAYYVDDVDGMRGYIICDLPNYGFDVCSYSSCDDCAMFKEKSKEDRPSISSELKPCKLCGCEGRTAMMNMLCFVFCTMCGAKTELFVFSEEARAAWNRGAYE